MEKRVGNVSIILLFLVLPFCYSTKLIDPVLPVQLFILSIITLAQTLYLYFSKSYKNLSHVALSLFAGYLIISILTSYSAINITESLIEIFKNFVYFILLINMLIFFSNTDYKSITTQIVTIFCFAIILIGIYQLYQVLKIGVYNHQLSYKIKSVFANRNMFAEVLLLTIPFVSYYFIKTQQKIWKIFTLTVLCANIFLIILLLVRTVWLGLFVSAIVTLFFYTILNWKNILIKSYRKSIIYISTLIITIVLSTYIYSKIDSTETLKKQVEWVKNYNFGSTQERIELWTKSLQLIKNNYITGVGSGNWKIVFPSYGITGLRSESGELLFQRPHNDFIWVLSETGILGFLFYFLFFAILFISIFKSIYSKKSDLFNYFLLFALISYIIISFFSFPKERISQSILLIIIVAFILSDSDSLSILKKWLLNFASRFIVILFIIINIYIIFFSYKRVIAEIHTKNAIQFKKEKKFINTISEIEKINTFYYNIDPISTPIKWYSGMAYLSLNKVEDALNQFSDANKANPYHLRNLNNLASCYFKKKNYLMAEQYYKEALLISKNFQESIFNLSVVYLLTEKYDSSYKYISCYKAENEKTKQIVLTSLPHLIDSFIKVTPDTILTDVFTGIKATEQWMYNIHNKSIKNKISFKKQLYLDAIYVLDSVEHKINYNEALGLNAKYLNQ
ncbi:MAG: hypothetical protein A2033_13225 [Bacteroidetes bacterium GWA2_31_9]|nr:MAG: hypothetical protein A2033_13225 [Bacteroidetes bacterium GWA2_31_9]